jgi:hypothetical protein
MSDFIREAFPKSHAKIMDRRLIDSAVEEACADFEHLSRTLAEVSCGKRMMSVGLFSDIEASLADLQVEIERRVAISTPTQTDPGSDG